MLEPQRFAACPRGLQQAQMLTSSKNRPRGLHSMHRKRIWRFCLPVPNHPATACRRIPMLQSRSRRTMRHCVQKPCKRWNASVSFGKSKERKGLRQAQLSFLRSTPQASSERRKAASEACAPTLSLSLPMPLHLLSWLKLLGWHAILSRTRISTSCLGSRARLSYRPRPA